MTIEMKKLKLELIMEAINELDRCYENKTVLKEAVSEKSLVSGLTLLALVGGSIACLPIAKKREKKKIYAAKADMKKRRDEIKKTLNYTLNEFQDTIVKDGENLGGSIKIKPGTDRAIDVTLMSIKNLYTNLNKVISRTNSNNIEDEIAKYGNEFYDKSRAMIDKIQASSDWIDPKNPKEIMEKLKLILDMEYKLFDLMDSYLHEDTSIDVDDEYVYTYLYDIEGIYKNLCKNIKVYLPKGERHPALKKFDKNENERINKMMKYTKPEDYKK